MESTATARALDAAEGRRADEEPLAGMLNRLREDGIRVGGEVTRYDFARIARETGISRAYISQYCNGKVQISGENYEKLLRYAQDALAADERASDVDAPEESARAYKTAIEIYQTSEFSEAVGLLDWAWRNHKMVVMTGYPGIGKTTILREFALRAPGARIITCRPTMRMRDLVNAIAEEMCISVGGSNDDRVRRIMQALKGREGEMLIFDEADHLYVWDVKKFEVIRQIWDETGVPVVLAGPPRLEELLTRGSGRQNLSQLYRRKFEIRLSGIRPGEVRDILREYNVEEDAARELAAIALDTRHGGLGNFVEIFGLCLDAADGGRVTRAILEESRRYKLQG